MKKNLLSFSLLILLSAYNETVRAQNQTINGNLNVTQGTQLTGNAQVGTTTQFSQFIVYGNSFVGSAAHPTQFNVNGNVFFHNDLNVDGTATFGALGTTNVNGNMMLHKDVFVDGTTWLGATNIGNTSTQQQLIVYGNSFLQQNLTVAQGTTLTGQTQIGTSSVHSAFLTYGPTFLGTTASPQTVNVNGNTFLHNNFVVDSAAYIGGLTPIRSSIFGNYRLWVQKGVVSEDFAIAPTADWADYVFNDGYKLKPLTEVEAYLKTNKHLSEIPSQAEVQKDGFSMRQINVTLLKKVEELTLYTIGQDKKAAEQDKKLEQLTAQMAQLKAAIEKMNK